MRRSESAWARGQAWALYSYTMCYRETKNPAYLQQAEHIAAFILNHPNLPADLIPYYDFNAPGIPNEPRFMGQSIWTSRTASRPKRAGMRRLTNSTRVRAIASGSARSTK